MYTILFADTLSNNWRRGALKNQSPVSAAMRLYCGENAFALPVSNGEPAAGSDGYSWSNALRSAGDEPRNHNSEM